jgi:hypothetical protein
MEEMLDDAMNTEDDEEVEVEADEEVDKVLFELTNGKLGQAGTVDTQPPVSTLPPYKLSLNRMILCRLLRPMRSKQRGRWSATGNSSTVYSVGRVWSDPFRIIWDSIACLGIIFVSLVCLTHSYTPPSLHVRSYITSN